MRVAVLCTRARSPYLAIEGADCFDAARDARSFAFDAPVIAHPPCRGWSRLRHFAKVREGELELALFCLEAVRRCGGVLEHPLGSKLLGYLVGAGQGRADCYGGRLVAVDQCDFGHRAIKRTWLYVVRRSLPALPGFGVARVEVERMGRAERERTPAPFARWLFDLAAGVV